MKTIRERELESRIESLERKLEEALVRRNAAEADAIECRRKLNAFFDRTCRYLEMKGEMDEAIRIFGFLRAD